MNAEKNKIKQDYNKKNFWVLIKHLVLDTDTNINADISNNTIPYHFLMKHQTK